MSDSRTSPLPAPLIVTLELEPDAQQWFEHKRREHFPRTLNRVPAHLSLFHALPGQELAAVSALLAQEATGTQAFVLEVHDVMKLGRGVAYALRAPELDRVHARLRAAWLAWLTPQDLQGFRPHIVVQNKTDPDQARALYAELDSSFRPWQVQAHALLLWHYRGGPWELAARFPFRSSPPESIAEPGALG